MIVTRSWLNEWIDISKLPTSDLCTIFNRIGLEVGSQNSYRMPEKVVVGKVMECERHPNADKLNVCLVDVGEKILQIVCGAKNVAAGQYVAVAMVGATLPGDFSIKEATLRGVQSFGMICSAQELGLPKLNDGIMVLDGSIGKLELGCELASFEIFNDDVIEIELTANRGDCLSIHGIARELSAVLGSPLKTVEPAKKDEYQLGIGRILHLAHEGELDCNLMYGAISNKPFEVPLKIALRLGMAQEQRGSAIEDFLTYVTYSTGVILRAYGHEFFVKEKGTEKATVRIKADEEGFDAVYDSKKASVVGIFQNEESKPSAIDKIIILEASYIPAAVVSKKYFRSKIPTDWVYYRASRGSEPNIKFGMDYLFMLLGKYTPVELYGGTSEYISGPKKVVLSISIKSINKIIGQDIAKGDMIHILKKLQFGIVKSDEDNLVVEVPAFRHDIANVQDIAEEIVRMVGIDNIASKPLEMAERRRINPSYLLFKNKKALRERAVAAGFFEVVNYVFTQRDILRRYGFDTVFERMDLANPITGELDTLRSTLLIGLLQSASRNANSGKKSIRLFEVGSVFGSNRSESQKIAFLFSGSSEEERFLNRGKPAPVDFGSFVQRVSLVLGEFDIVQSTPTHSLAHPYQNGSVLVEGRVCGSIFKLHLQAQREFDLGATYLCELDMDALPQGLKVAKPYSRFQPLYRDLSLLVSKDISYSLIQDLIGKMALAEIKSFYPIDLYESEELGDKRSLTVRFLIQSDFKTLTEEEVSALVERILVRLNSELGIVLR